MSNVTEKELEELISRFVNNIENAQKDREEVPDDREHLVDTSIGMASRRIGIYTVLLGEYDDAVEWFNKASENRMKAWAARRGHMNEPQRLLWTLVSAILSKDDATRQAVADAGPIEETDPEYFTQFDYCLQGLLRGDDDTVREAAEYLDEHEHEAYAMDDYDGLGTACRAIVDGDSKLLDDSLAQILDRHEALRPTRAETMDDALVCIPATVLAILAVERGIDVSALRVFGNEYVPWDYVE